MRGANFEKHISMKVPFELGLRAWDQDPRPGAATKGHLSSQSQFHAEPGLASPRSHGKADLIDFGSAVPPPQLQVVFITITTSLL